jgi:hypothetical protein
MMMMKFEAWMLSKISMKPFGSHFPISRLVDGMKLHFSKKKEKVKGHF